jgi:PD-(D/E)XK nuclease superfamily
MRSSDPQADNLFSRLLSYTPQEKGQTPLENFCTESLAWCLRSSPEFQKKFLNLIRAKLSSEKRRLLQAGFDKSQVDIHTQFPFKDDEESDGGNDSENKRGFFDLVIRSNPSDNFVLVVEVKFYSPFGKTQISHYRRELDGGQSFQSCAGKFLITLTIEGIPEEIKSKLDAFISWPEVLEALRETIVQNEDSQVGGERSPVVTFMLKQFADFLKEKDVTPMKIDLINLEDLNATVFFRFQAASAEILKRFRNEQIHSWKPKQVKYDVHLSDLHFEWGVYSRAHKWDWCGFMFFYDKKPPELRMHIEGSFRKGIKLNQIESHLGKVLTKAVQQKCFKDDNDNPNSTWLFFWQPINSDYNGKADKIYGWLSSASKEFLKLKEKFGSHLP